MLGIVARTEDGERRHVRLSAEELTGFARRIGGGFDGSSETAAAGVRAAGDQDPGRAITVTLAEGRPRRAG